MKAFDLVNRRTCSQIIKACCSVCGEFVLQAAIPCCYLTLCEAGDFNGTVEQWRTLAFHSCIWKSEVENFSLKFNPRPPPPPAFSISAGIFKQSVGARNRVEKELSYRSARLHGLAELVPWNRFSNSLKVLKFELRSRRLICEIIWVRTKHPLCQIYVMRVILVFTGLHCNENPISIFLFWEYLFRIFAIGSLQCRECISWPQIATLPHASL